MNFIFIIAELFIHRIPWRDDIFLLCNNKDALSFSISRMILSLIIKDKIRVKEILEHCNNIYVIIIVETSWDCLGCYRFIVYIMKLILMFYLK